MNGEVVASDSSLGVVSGIDFTDLSGHYSGIFIHEIYDTNHGNIVVFSTSAFQQAQS